MPRGDKMRRLTDAERDEAEKHIPLALFLIKKLNKDHPKHLDRDDQHQEGALGIMRAVQDYDPSKAKFGTYAFRPVRDFVTSADMADHLIRIPQRQFYDKSKCEAYTEHVERGLSVRRVSHEMMEQQKSAVRTDDEPDEEGDAETVSDLIRDAMESLACEERFAIKKLYFEGWTLIDLGLHLDLSDHHTKALRSKALQKLRSHLQEAV